MCGEHLTTSGLGCMYTGSCTSRFSFQETGDAESKSPARLRAEFGVRTAFLLGGDIRQKLLPLLSFRS